MVASPGGESRLASLGEFKSAMHVQYVHATLEQEHNLAFQL